MGGDLLVVISCALKTRIPVSGTVQVTSLLKLLSLFPGLGYEGLACGSRFNR